MKHYLLTFVAAALAIGGVVYFIPKDVVVEGARVTSQAPVSPQFDSRGGILPDPTKTPGALNSDVTQDTIAKTICVSGWTGTIRPPSTYTSLLKLKQLKDGYTVNGDMLTKDYEEDHLISLELGGNPTSEQNLWPESYLTTPNAHQKDLVENYLKKEVCAHRMNLNQAQYLISHDWTAVYSQFVVKKV